MAFIVPPSARSWVEVSADSHFPIQNLPFARFRRPDGSIGLASAIGDRLIDIDVLRKAGFLNPSAYSDLTGFSHFSRESLGMLRQELFHLLKETSPVASSESVQEQLFTPLDNAELLIPIQPSAFIDFYSGVNHAANVGRMFRPEQPPLLPHYKHVPIAYNGRASSVVVSGTPITRPAGQFKLASEPGPSFGPTREMDFELELGFYLGGGTKLGEVVPIDRVADLILGFVLVNDWSARDVQRWEYQPLGPFLAKSFATTISPWIVHPDALEPFRVKRIPNSGDMDDPAELPYLRSSRPLRYDIQLQVDLRARELTEYNQIAATSAQHLYWSFDQQLAHQSSNGTPLQHGDLYASGTISGTETGTYGSLLELSKRGAEPVKLPGGIERSFLADGDSVRLSGYCKGEGFKIGFGQAEGTILPTP